MPEIIVIGAGGQIGTELVTALREKHGSLNVVASDLLENCPPLFDILIAH